MLQCQSLHIDCKRSAQISMPEAISTFALWREISIFAARSIDAAHSICCTRYALRRKRDYHFFNPPNKINEAGEGTSADLQLIQIQAEGGKAVFDEPVHFLPAHGFQGLHGHGGGGVELGVAGLLLLHAFDVGGELVRSYDDGATSSSSSRTRCS